MRWLLVWVIVLATTAGNVLQALGMRHHGEILDFRLGALGRVATALVRSRYIMASILAMAISFFAFMALLSFAELSFAVPATAASYILETVLAKYVLNEQVGRKRWAGVLLVAVGVGLLTV